MAGGNLNSGVFSEFAITEMDDAGAAPNYPSGQHGGGHCYQQNTTELTSFQPFGGYVFGMRGEDIWGNLEGLAGYVKYASGSVSGVIDIVDRAAAKAAGF